MFSYIKGPLVEVWEGGIVVEAGGIGWNILVPLSVLDRLPRIGEELKIYTSFQVREDAMTLYGFFNSQDRKMFNQLLGVNGIGPKAALGILSALQPDDLRMAILSEDAKAIARAPGIGPKTAKRVILDLKDRIRMEDVLPSAFGAEMEPAETAGSGMEGTGGYRGAGGIGIFPDGSIQGCTENRDHRGYDSRGSFKGISEVSGNLSAGQIQQVWRVRWSGES